MTIRRVHFPAVIFSAAMVLTTMLGHAAPITLQMQGIVDTSSTIPALQGQQWTLQLTYDPGIADQDASSSKGYYVNGADGLSIRSFDLSVGGNSIHLVDPTPSTYPDDIWIKISTQSTPSKSKTLSFYVGSALLPTWEGYKVNDLFFILADQDSLGFWDGTDSLPTDTGLTLSNFSSGNGLSISLGGDLFGFVGTPTSLSLAAVPEPSPVLLIGLAATLLLACRIRRVHDR